MMLWNIAKWIEVNLKVNDKNIEVCTLFDNVDVKLTLNYLKEEMRVYIWDSDKRYVDDWAYDVGEDIESLLKEFYAAEKEENGITKLISTAFGKKAIMGASLKDWSEAIKKYGYDLVNRIGSNILITYE